MANGCFPNSAAACVLLLGIGASAAFHTSAHADCWPGFTPASEFSEQVREIRFACEARTVIVAPDAAHFDPARPTQLVIYATPNGNTIEQTLGCRAAEGRDWHFDIQHAAAQVRLWRSVHEAENIVLACVQANMLSWPAWRQKYPEHEKLIQQMMAAIVGQIPGDGISTVLTGHSGGGSFITGFLNSVEEIPASVRRIAYLDANYSYSTEEQHGHKFLQWLKSSTGNQLIVLAYDDREIELNGKKVVGPTGGTFRASHRLLDYLRESVLVDQDQLGEFDQYSACGGQLRVLLHPNAENKILHTRLVGEMNGLAYALAVGTAEEAAWGTLGAPRAYSEWVQREPFEPTRWSATAPAIPPRRPGAVTGSQFIQRWKDAPAEAREAAALGELLQGNVPDFLRTFVEIPVGRQDGESSATLRVAPDYLAIGSDDDFLRLPVTPATAQAVADTYDCLLPTCKLVDEIHRHAEFKVPPHPLTEDRELLATFARHHAIIEKQLMTLGGRPGQLVAGIKKDLVISNQVHQRPGHVAIYGWHYQNGQPIQPLTTVHVDWYVDYSHGVRLVHQQATIDGESVRLSELVADDQSSQLISDEGPMRRPFYPWGGE